MVTWSSVVLVVGGGFLAVVVGAVVGGTVDVVDGPVDPLTVEDDVVGLGIVPVELGGRAVVGAGVVRAGGKPEPKPGR